MDVAAPHFKVQAYDDLGISVTYDLIRSAGDTPRIAHGGSIVPEMDTSPGPGWSKEKDGEYYPHFLPMTISQVPAL